MRYAVLVLLCWCGWLTVAHLASGSDPPPVPLLEARQCYIQHPPVGDGSRLVWATLVRDRWQAQYADSTGQLHTIDAPRARYECWSPSIDWGPARSGCAGLELPADIFHCLRPQLFCQPRSEVPFSTPATRAYLCRYDSVGVALSEPLNPYH